MSQAWKDHQKIRITSSLFGDVAKATERKDMTKLANSILNPKHFSTKATRHGQLYEKVAIEKYESCMNCNVTQSGLVVSADVPYLAASPDGMVGDNICLEIKCPFVARDRDITPATVPFIDSLGLKRNHNYYYQVQGQLFCTGRTECHFCVYTLKDFRVFSIARDDEFISQMVDSLKAF